jgi:DNA replication and repair protein RecF
VTGPNGVGKTNLLEALHVGSQGFSPRTRAEMQLVRFGEEAARVGLAGVEADVDVETRVVIRPREPKRIDVNGAPVASAEELRMRLSTLVFSPDRLAVVKGGPIVRRAYFDRMLGRIESSRAALPGEYARALSQRNAALRRVHANLAPADALTPWTEAVVALGSELDAARADLVEVLAPAFACIAELLGLSDASLRYERRPLVGRDLDERLPRDLERGVTGVGPHLRDVGISAGSRDLRSYGSQGEQRAAVLALVLAEAELVRERRRTAPLLLLDDVLSELDEERRAALLAVLPRDGQTIVTTTSAAALPQAGPEPAQVVSVTPGKAA